MLLLLLGLAERGRVARPSEGTGAPNYRRGEHLEATPGVKVGHCQFCAMLSVCLLALANLRVHLKP